MRFARDYRVEAAEKTKPQAGTLAIIALIVTIVSAIIGFSIKETQIVNGVEVETSYQPLGFISFFITGQIAVSWKFISQKVYHGEKVGIKDLFYGFKDYVRILGAYVLQSIYLALWTLLFVIPGIVKAFSYSMTYFLLDEDETLTANEAITLSRKLMDGKKWKLFCLELSYIGWVLLSALTLGILLLWVEPRMKEAQYIFFREVYEEAGYTCKGEDKVVLNVEEEKVETVEENTEE